MKTHESIRELWRQVDRLNDRIKVGLAAGKGPNWAHGLIASRTAIMHGIEALDIVRNGEAVSRMRRVKALLEPREDAVEEAAQ